MQVLLARPRGFCAGVDRAIEIVERALALHGAPIYVRHEVVHNRYVVDDLRAKGAVFAAGRRRPAAVPAGPYPRSPVPFLRSPAPSPETHRGSAAPRRW